MFEFRVKCSNKLHTILLADNGQMNLVDHRGGKEERAELRAMQALGSDCKVRCMQILDLWRSRKLPEARLLEMPDMLRRLWRYRTKDTAAWRWAGKQARRHRKTFVDFNDKSAYELDPALAGNDKALAKREQAMKALVAGLEKRGFAPTYKIGKETTGSGVQYHHCYISALNDSPFGVHCDSGNGSVAAMRIEGYDLPVIVNDIMYTSACADLVIAAFMHKRRLAHARQVKSGLNQKAVLERLRAASKKYSALKPKIAISTNRWDPSAHVELGMLCDSSVELSIILSKINKAVKELIEKKRVTAMAREPKFNMPA